MISLFLDTAAHDMTIGIYRDMEELYLLTEENDNHLSEKLLPAIKKAFESISMTIKDIDRIYVVDGPGSFTGIRIGITVAKIVAWALKKEIIPVSKLELIASTDTNGKNKLALIDARHDHVYAGMYDATLNLVTDDCYTSIEEISPKIERHKNDTPINPHELKPNYLKRTEAEEKHDSSCG